LDDHDQTESVITIDRNSQKDYFFSKDKLAASLAQHCCCQARCAHRPEISATLPNGSARNGSPQPLAHVRAVSQAAPRTGTVQNVGDGDAGDMMTKTGTKIAVMI
jgi:hypothetical protein